jgi:hypothetical protein
VQRIEAYVAELGRALRGPRGLKADLLAEARDGLVDAAEAHQESGLDADDAQRLAISDFGTVAEVSGDYQAELGLSQGRRTGVLICLAMVAQPVAWDVWRLFSGGQGIAGPAYPVIDQWVRWTGAASIAGGLLIVVALGAGTRYLRSPRPLIRAAGIFGFAVVAVVALLGVLLTAVNPATGPLLGWSGLPSTLLLLGLPLSVVAVAARRCLAAARPVPGPAAARPR